METLSIFILGHQHMASSEGNDFLQLQDLEHGSHSISREQPKPKWAKLELGCTAQAVFKRKTGSWELF